MSTTIHQMTSDNTSAAHAAAAYKSNPCEVTWTAYQDAMDRVAAASIVAAPRGDYGTCAALPMADEERVRADVMAAEMCADSSCDTKSLILARRVLDLLGGANA